MPHKDLEKRRACKKRYYLKNLNLCKERSRKQRMTFGHKEHIEPIKRKSLLKKRYGITQDDYLKILEKQDFKCAVCKTEKPGTSKSNYFDVDHNHETGSVRGLLCRNCNVTLGVLEKKRNLLMKLEAYLILHAEFDPK
jgi:hypothetical protein